MEDQDDGFADSENEQITGVPDSDVRGPWGQRRS